MDVPANVRTARDDIAALVAAHHARFPDPPRLVEMAGDARTVREIDDAVGQAQRAQIQADARRAAVGVLTKRIRDRRGQALADAMTVALSSATEVDVDGYHVHIGGVSVHLKSGAVELHDVVVTKDGALVGHHVERIDGELVTVAGIDPHRVYANPPLLFPDPAGDVHIDRTPVTAGDDQPAPVLQRHRVDPAAVVLALIVEAARAGGP